MYKAFIESQQKKLTKNDIPEVEPEIKNAVDKIWQQIETQCQQLEEGKRISDIKPEKKLVDWKIVRLFVSSTFADFFNEREVLIKKVFPELKEWCQQRHLKLIECDLRWGVPQDTATEQTVSICLEEIDKCIDVANGYPLFIGLLGDRYGWVPSDKDISLDVREKYQWVDGTSITCMEVLHGAYRTRNPNAAFFMRNSSVYSDIPQSDISYFVEKSPLASYQLQVMKDKLEAAVPNQIFHYEPKFKQISSAGVQKAFVELEDFEEFSQKVLEFFKSAILRIHPHQERTEIDPVSQEKELQWLYVLDKSNNFIGRQTEKAALTSYLIDGEDGCFEKTVGASSQLRVGEDWDVCDGDTPVCVIEAASGWGKTSLLCALVTHTVDSQSDWQVFYHFVGSTPSSVQTKWLLRCLLTTLMSEPQEEDKTTINEGRWEEQKKLLRRALNEFRKQPHRKLIVILDNLNGLSNADSVDHLSWLPPAFPPNILCLVSTNQHVPTTARLYEQPALRMRLCDMTEDELSSLAVCYLDTFSKKLHPDQLTALIKSTGVNNPLWLTLVVEELRIFGSFRHIDQRIAELPNSLHGFLVQVFDRLVREDSMHGLVKKVLCVTACSQYGLPADQVLQVCGDIKARQPVALLHWLQVRRWLQPYLRMSGALEEAITFSHEAVRTAVFDHFMPTSPDVCHWHSVLADFYQYWCDDGRLKTRNLLYHLHKARLLSRIVEFMRKDKMSHMFLAPYQRSNYLKDCRCRMLADPVIPGNSPMMLCYNCSVKPHGFNPGVGWSNKSCCVVCGCLVPGNKPVLAHTCMKHVQRRGAEMVKCVLCPASVNLKGKPSGNMAPSVAILCAFCSAGVGGRMCAALSCG